MTTFNYSNIQDSQLRKIRSYGRFIVQIFFPCALMKLWIVLHSISYMWIERFLVRLRDIKPSMLILWLSDGVTVPGGWIPAIAYPQKPQIASFRQIQKISSFNHLQYHFLKVSFPIKISPSHCLSWTPSPLFSSHCCYYSFRPHLRVLDSVIMYFL